MNPSSPAPDEGWPTWKWLLLIPVLVIAGPVALVVSFFLGAVGFVSQVMRLGYVRMRLLLLGSPRPGPETDRDDASPAP